MSEAAGMGPIESGESITPPFKVIEGGLETTAAYFVIPGQFQLDSADLQPILSEARDGRNMLINLLEKLRGLPSAETRHELKTIVDSLEATPREELTPLQEKMLDSAKAQVDKRSLIVSIVDAARLDYEENYWHDYEHRQGQDSDKLEVLYDSTDAYEDTALLASIDNAKNLKVKASNPGIVLEAERIARILIKNEVEAT